MRALIKVEISVGPSDDTLRHHENRRSMTFEDFADVCEASQYELHCVLERIARQIDKMRGAS